MDDSRSDLGYLVNKAARLLRLRLADALVDTGLTPQQAAVLMAIARSEDAMLTPGGVAESIDTDAATTSGLLNRLTRDGWLVSAPHPRDGRSRLFRLTDQSVRVLPDVMAAARGASACATSGLTGDEVKGLTETLARMCAAEEEARNREVGSR